MKYVLYSCGEQPINKHYLQMERHVYDKDVVGCVQKDIVMWCDKGYGQWFWSEQDIARLREDGKKLLDPETARRAMEHSRQAVKHYWARAIKLRSSIGGGEAEKLADDYCGYAYALRRIYAHFNTTVAHSTYAVEERLKKIIGQKTGGKTGEVFNLLTAPSQPNLLLDELNDWLNATKNGSDEALLAHAIKYPIYLANVFSESAALQCLRERLDAEDPAGIEKKVARAESEKSELKERQFELLGKLGSTEAERLSWFLQQAALSRLEIKNCWNGEAFHMLPLFREISGKGECSVRDAYFFYTWKDALSLLKEGKNLEANELAERKQSCLLLFRHGQISVYSGGEALEKKKEILGPSLPDRGIRQIRGTIANKGVAEGPVKIIRADNPSELRAIASSLTGKEIIVTGMTNPTMLPLFPKVRGIITDEGGAACHAAILSREFNLPCLVGCKIATLTLADGENVILDANKGVITRQIPK